MPKTRVYELAKRYGYDSKSVLAMLADLGDFVQSASSELTSSQVRRWQEALDPSSKPMPPTDGFGTVYSTETGLANPTGAGSAWIIQTDDAEWWGESQYGTPRRTWARGNAYRYRTYADATIAAVVLRQTGRIGNFQVVELARPRHGDTWSWT